VRFLWRGEDLLVRKGRYPNGSDAWVATRFGEPSLTLTVAMGYKPPPGFVLIKNYSENEGVLDALVEQHIVEDTKARLDAGFALEGVAVCRALFDPIPLLSRR